MAKRVVRRTKTSTPKTATTTLTAGYGQQFQGYAKLHTQLSPNWRDARIQSILNQPGRCQPRKADDPLVKAMFRYRQVKNQLVSMHMPEFELDQRLASMFGPIHTGHVLHQDVIPLMRMVIEARILARQTDEQIAKLTSLPAEAVQVYHDAFFDVRDKLDAMDWITTQVIGQVFQIGDQRSNPELLSKYFGYFGGPMILEAVLYGMQSGAMVPHSSADIAQWLENNLRFKLKTQSAVLLTTYAPNRFDFMSVISSYAQIASLELREKDLVGEDNVLTAILSAVQLTNTIKLGDDASFTPPPTDVYANSTVVPRVEDRPQLAQKHVPTALTKYADPNYTITLSPKHADTNQPKHPAKGD